MSWFVIFVVWIALLPSRATRAKYTVTSLRINHLQEAVENKTLSVWEWISIVSKIWVFPFFFMTYVLFLLIEQTHIFNLHYHYLFLSIDASWLLWMTIVSWVVSVLYNEQTMHNRTIQYASPLLWRLYCILSGLLWILWSYILYSQIINLTTYAYIIATIAWIIILLIGFLWVEDQDG